MAVMNQSYSSQSFALVQVSPRAIRTGVSPRTQVVLNNQDTIVLTVGLS